MKDYRHKLSEEPYANHVEVAVLNLVACLYKDIFADLNDFCSEYLHFDDDTVLRFSREISFICRGWIIFAQFARRVLPFHYPTLCDTTESFYTLNGFDLGLASTLQEGP